MRRVETTIVCDITGEPGARTVTFAVDGAEYEIDLVAETENALRSSLAGFVESARPVKGSRGQRRHTRSLGTAPATVDPAQRKAIRTWAQANGFKVGDRGRIPQEAIDAYQAAAGRQHAMAS